MNIDLSPVADRIRSIASVLFRGRTKKALVDFPDYNFSIVDESILVQDFQDSIKDTSAVLIKKKDYNTIWRIGFFRGL